MEPCPACGEDNHVVTDVRLGPDGLAVTYRCDAFALDAREAMKGELCGRVWTRIDTLT